MVESFLKLSLTQPWQTSFQKMLAIYQINCKQSIYYRFTGYGGNVTVQE
jgi:hypothetical protein